MLAKLLGTDDAPVRRVLNSWGLGTFEAEVTSRKGFRPDGKAGAVLRPPAFGLAGVNLGTLTGLGSTTYGNAVVASVEMHTKGTFSTISLMNKLIFVELDGPRSTASVHDGRGPRVPSLPVTLLCRAPVACEARASP